MEKLKQEICKLNEIYALKIAERFNADDDFMHGCLSEENAFDLRKVCDLALVGNPRLLKTQPQFKRLYRMLELYCGYCTIGGVVIETLNSKLCF